LALLFGKAEEFESGSRAASVPHDGDSFQRMLAQPQIDFHGFSHGEAALHESTKAAFTDIESDAARGIDASLG
jgi:hypothetical protein